MIGKLNDVCLTCNGETRLERAPSGEIIDVHVECATCDSTGLVPHVCTTCSQAHTPREDFGVFRAPICCEGCECGLHAGNAPQGCENCSELSLCFAAAEKRQSECPRELALREAELANGDWDIVYEEKPVKTSLFEKILRLFS